MKRHDPMTRTWPLLAALLSSGCTSTPLVLCDQIPEGGCPLDRGGTCDDRACAALYGCYDGVWKVVEVCEENTGGAGGAECTSITFDRSMETTGCMPPLQSPDCPAAVAEDCPEKACTTGCTDFFLCTAEGWIGVAYCDEDGNFFQAPR
jgi:hypothetical protein